MSDYEPTDSESDYDENEKILLQNVRKGKYDSPDESEEEVFNVGHDESDSDDDDDEIELADSDIEGQANDDGIPNENAWGKDRRRFYSTDFIDPDYEDIDEKTARLAELEEEEATRLQLKLAQQLDDDDFGLDFLKQDSTEIKDEKVEEKIKTDTSKLTKREKIQFLKKESPELFGLLNDFKVKMDIQKNFLEPVLKRYRLGQISNSPAMDFVQTFNNLILNYSVNIYMYLLLKSHKTKLDNHPVVRRLNQYRLLLEKLGKTFEEVLKDQIRTILEEKKNLEVSEKLKENKRKKLKVFEKVEVTKEIARKKKKAEKDLNSLKVKKDNIVTEKIMENDDIVTENIENPIDDSLENIEEYNKLDKRGITYQIAKNKGLTPRRKKEQRNPRVKHRNKFRKAIIRRKGAVREVRTELKRYAGEISGIKATVTKSRKLKS